MNTDRDQVMEDLDREKLSETISVYEQIINDGNTDRYLYWYLGLAYLLAEQETEAQTTWFIPLVEASETEEKLLTTELVTILTQQFDHELKCQHYDRAWLINQYLQLFDPANPNHLLSSILLSINIGDFEPEILDNCLLLQPGEANSEQHLSPELLIKVIDLLLDFPTSTTLNFIDYSLSVLHQPRTQTITDIANLVLARAHRFHDTYFPIQVLEICQQLDDCPPITFKNLSLLYSHAGCHQQAITTAHQFYELCTGLADRIIGNHGILRAMLTAGNWQNIDPIVTRHYQLLTDFVQTYPDRLSWELNQFLLPSIVFLPYIADRPEIHKLLQNQIAQIYQHNIPTEREINLPTPAALDKPPQVIRIGYLASTLRRHSVGWLSRWLWQYHNRDRFQIFTYTINQNPADSFYQQWFRDRSDISYCFGTDTAEIASQIHADCIDILVDLDSLTLNISSQVLALKPAPIQVTWLGWDATSLPTVDYFIADRYALPENAQDYYREKIWRLPTTYLAVDGFEVGESTITRQSLGIPEDAIIYWSAQTGYKRHPDTVHLQMQILKAVPNSYLLIKGISDREIIQDFFATIASEEGVDFDRLRFLDLDPDEYTHRANLSIADIVLDTFPYNGATTTLETLWMGIPLVTRVGQQFAARNSYTFMINAGITEGIAQTAAEYLAWGIRLGQDADLRQQIRAKLRASRYTAPLWRSEQFTHDLEEAYTQMWAIYQQSLN